MPLPWLLIRGAWLILIFYWIAAWRWSSEQPKRTERAQGPSRQWGHVAALMLTALLMAVGPHRRLYAPSAVVQWCAAGLAVAGCTLAIVARTQLGTNWSPHATLKTGQDLVQAGAYAVSRHPIYTGVLAMLAASALALGELRGVLALGVLTYSFYQKANAEESLLQDHFGVVYASYRQRVKRLVPLFW